MADERLYTRDEALQMAREQWQDVVGGLGLFTDAVARWFVSMLEDSPGLAERQADLILRILADLIDRRDPPQGVRQEAERLGQGLKFVIEGIARERDR